MDERARRAPAPGRKIDLASSAVRSQRARLAAIRNDFRTWLRQNAPNARITRRRTSRCTPSP